MTNSTQDQTKGGIVQFQLGRQTEIRPWQHGAAFLLACAVIISRRPDAIFHAQFWAEDGRIFFADAYNLGGWPALFRTYAGYFHVVPRLGALLALLAPLAAAPLVLNIIAILVQAAPVNLLLSARSSAWGSLGFRALMATTYLALPDNAEITFGITLSQWILALCMILLIVASAPKGWVGRAFDCTFLVLAGLSGPFCLLVLPIAVFLAWRRKEAWRWVQCAILAACSATQLWALLILDPNGRPNSPLGANAAILARILGGDVFADALLGRVQLAVLPGTGAFIFLVCAAVVGVAIVAACFLKARLEMRLFLVFAGMILFASLMSPMANPPAGTTMWELLVRGAAIRYWFMPSLAFVWSLLWCARSGSRVLKSTAAVLLCCMAFGVPLNWENPRFGDQHFGEYVKAFEAAPQGTVMIVPENAPGWTMRLVKHAEK